MSDERITIPEGPEVPFVRSISRLKFDFKKWKLNKREVEARLFANLQNAFDANDPIEFRTALGTCFNELEKIYEKLETRGENNQGPAIPKTTIHQRVLKNDQLHLMISRICRKEGSSKLIEIFLEKVPIINEQLDKYFDVPEINQEATQRPTSKRGKEPNRVIHIAIKAEAFENVKTLLRFSDVDVNLIWSFKKYTPFMMLLSVVNSDNFSKVMQIIEILAEKRADINIGDFKMHSMSVICKLQTVEHDEKMKLLMFCLKHFDYDLDGLYKGQARKDIGEFGIDEMLIRQTKAEVTYNLLKSFVMEKKEEEFCKRFDSFYKSDNLDKVYELLQFAASKGCDVSVKTMFKFLTNDTEYTNSTKKQTHLSKVLKVVCQNGFARVLKLFLENIKSAIDNDHPLLLTCLRELRKSRSPLRQKCFQLVLHERRIMVDARDDQNQTALHFAVQHGMDQEAKDILRRKPAPYLWTLNNRNESPLHSMSAEVLEAFLDSKISISADCDDKRKEIHLDLTGLRPPRRNSASEIDLFYFIAESKELRPLLTHPVINLYILTKWLFIRWITYGMFGLSLGFAIFFIFYALYNTSTLKIFCWLFFLLCFIRWILITLNPIWLTVWKWSKNNQTNIRRVHKFRALNKLRETAMVVLAGYSLKVKDHTVLAVLILLIGIDVIVHLRLFPYASLTTSIVMLETVSKSFLKILLIYLIIIISFGCSFFVLFDDYGPIDSQLQDQSSNSTDEESFNNFSTLEGSLLKSLVMMIGEFDASEISFDRNALSYVMFISFVFFVTLVVANLINGVAVSDISEIRQQAQVAALANRVEMLRRFEKFLLLDWIRNCRQKSLFFTRYDPKIIVRINESNTIVLIRKKAKFAKRDALINGPTGQQFSDSTEPSLKAKNPERKFHVLPRNHYYHGVDEEVCNAAKVIAIRNESKPQPQEWFPEQMARLETRISRMESKLDRLLKEKDGGEKSGSQQNFGHQ